MRINKIYRVLSIIIIALALHSCVKDGNFTVPKISIKEPNIKVNSNISAIQSALIQEFKTKRKLVYQFPDKKNLWVLGYVVSSDKTGNFYKKLIIQDKPEKPTAGIEISINKTALSETFDFGRKVYILLDGLSVSYDPVNAVGEKFILGKDNGKEKLDKIAATTYTNHIKRSAEVAKIIPTKITIKDFGQQNINTFVELTDMQFQKQEIGKTFSGEATDRYDGLRTLTDGSADIALQTSTFSSFKSNIIPEKRGSVVAVLTKDFKAENYVLIIKTPSDLKFTEKRKEIKTKIESYIPPFEQGFQTAKDRTKANFIGWTNFAEKGNRLWRERKYKGNGFLEFNAYKSNDAENIGWLISPAINMDTTKNEVLTFKTAKSRVDSDENKIEVFVSTNYNGKDVLKATWKPIVAQVVKKADKNYTFKSSDNVDLSAYKGKLYVAFKVTGSGTNPKLDGAFRVDDFKISGSK